MGLILHLLFPLKETYTLGDEKSNIRIAVLDFGIKRNILNCMVERGAYVKVFNADTEFNELEKFSPHGYFISNGPGDPEPLHYAVKTIKEIFKSKKPLIWNLSRATIVCIGK